MNNWKKGVALFFVLITLHIGCGPIGSVKDSGKISGIYKDEITNHGEKHLSCYIKDPKGQAYTLFDFHPSQVRRMPDLKFGERAWIRCKNYRKDGDRFLGGTMEIHCLPENLENESQGINGLIALVMAVTSLMI